MQITNANANFGRKYLLVRKTQEDVDKRVYQGINGMARLGC